MVYCAAMALTAEEIRQVLAEIAPALTGGWAQKVSQPHDEAITLEVRAQGKTLTLYIAADPETARLHVLSKKYSNPPTPPPFCQLLRARLEGGRIEAMRQITNDRIVHIAMTRDGQPVTLVAELTGRTANVLLLNHDHTVQGQLRKGRFKNGDTYAAPTSQAPPRSPRPSPLEGVDKGEGAFPLSADLEHHFQERDEARAGARRREAVQNALGKKLTRARKLVEALASDLAKAERYRAYDRYGELLKSRLGDIPKGAASITVTDYFDPALPDLVLPLDPAKNPTGNMEDYFKKYRKFLGAEKVVRPRLLTAHAEVAALRESLSALDRDDHPAAVPIEQTPRRNRPAPASRKEQATGTPFRRFTTEAGDPILVGRNSRENEDLTFGLARSHDLWLHASGAPGSHVVLRVEKGTDARRASLLDAATLALQYSDLRKSGQGEVLYTARKHVRKPRGAKPGLVTVTQDKRLYVKLDQQRLKRLKASAGARDDP